MDRRLPARLPSRLPPSWPATRSRRAATTPPHAGLLRPRRRRRRFDATRGDWSPPERDPLGRDTTVDLRPLRPAAGRGSPTRSGLTTQAALRLPRAPAASARSTPTATGTAFALHARSGCSNAWPSGQGRRGRRRQPRAARVPRSPTTSPPSRRRCGPSAGSTTQRPACPPPERDETIERSSTPTASAGSVQTRTQAEDVRFGDPVFGGGVAAAEPGRPGDRPAVTGRAQRRVGPAQRRRQRLAVYDNKGRVVERYEPFFATGWDFRAARRGPARPAGRRCPTTRGAGCVAHRQPRRHRGAGRVRRARSTSPTPTCSRRPRGRRYTYDANDNAGRTHPAERRPATEHHWDTPASTRSTPSAGTVCRIDRPPRPATRRLPPVEVRAPASTTTSSGNLIAVTDALGRGPSATSTTWPAGVAADGEHRRRRRDTVSSTPPATESSAATARARSTLQRLRRAAPADPAVGPRRRRGPGDAARAHRVRRRRRPRPARRRAAGGPGRQPARRRRSPPRRGRAASPSTPSTSRATSLEQARRVIADAADPGRLRARPPAAGRSRRSTSTGSRRRAGPRRARRRAARRRPTYRTTTRFDALDRVATARCPADVDGRPPRAAPRLQPRRRAGAGRASTATPVVEHIAYDAKGQRTLIAFGNGVMTPLRLRPAHVRGSRGCAASATPDPGAAAPTGRPGRRSRTSRYDYDLAGNIARDPRPDPRQRRRRQPRTRAATDDAGCGRCSSAATPSIRRFAYDPLYRLVSATGRECDGEPDAAVDRRPAAASTAPATAPRTRTTPRTSPRVYTETYDYDAAGNLIRLRHTGDRAARLHPAVHLRPGSNRLARGVSAATTARLRLRRQRQPVRRERTPATSTGTTPTGCGVPHPGRRAPSRRCTPTTSTTPTASG